MNNPRFVAEIYPAGTDIYLPGTHQSPELIARRVSVTEEECADIPRQDYTVVFF